MMCTIINFFLVRLSNLFTNRFYSVLYCILVAANFHNSINKLVYMHLLKEDNKKLTSGFLLNTFSKISHLCKLDIYEGFRIKQRLDEADYAT